MASAKPIETIADSSRKDQYLHCQNCQSKGKKESRQLKCLHQFCLECLQSLEMGTFGQKQLRCPSCRELTVLPLSQEAKDLPQPVTVSRFEQEVDTLVKLPQGERGELICDLCAPVNAESVVYCLKCQKKLCHQCFAAHQKEKSLAAHSTLPITESVFCTQHAHQVVTVFCEECSKGLCLKCVLQGHNTLHTKLKLQDMVVNYRQEIQQNIQKHMGTYSKIKSLQMQASAMKRELSATKVYEELDKQLDTFQVMAIKAITDFVETTKSNINLKREELDEQGRKLDALYKAQDSLRSYAEQLVTKASVIDVACRAKEVNKLLTTGIELPMDLEYPVVEDKIQTMSDRIRELLNNHQVTYQGDSKSVGRKPALTGGRKADPNTTKSPERQGTRPKSLIVGETNYPTVQKPATKQMTLSREVVLSVGSEVTGLVFDVVTPYLVIRTVEKRRPVQLYTLQWAMICGWGADIPGLAEGGRISVDIKRGLYLATVPDKILVINKTGKLVSEISNSELSGIRKGLKLKKASGIGYSSTDDNYLVSDLAAHCVALIDPVAKKTVGKFGSKGSGSSQFNGPMYISYDDCGAIPAVVVSDHDNHCIKVFTTQGTHVQTYGCKGQGEAELQGPSGVCVDQAGQILVCDWGNQRVVRFWTKGGKVLWECVLSPEQLGGGSPRDIALHPARGLLAICVGFKHGEYKVFVYSGYQ